MEDQQVLELIVKPSYPLYYSKDKSFGIFSVVVLEESPDYDNAKLDGLVEKKTVLVGSMPNLEDGKQYVAKVTETVHPKYGLQYEVKTIYQQLFSTRNEQISFLKVLLTEKQMDTLLLAYPNENLVDLIENDKIDLDKTKGIGEVTIQKIKEKIKSNKRYQSAIVKLTAKYDIPYNAVKRLSDKYGSPDILLQKIKENPYLLTEVQGFGFKRVDEIALAMGVPEDSPKRLEACIDYCLEEEASNGHAWMKIPRIVEKVMKLTGLRLMDIQNFIHNMEEDEDKDFRNIQVENGIMYKKKYKYYEESIKNDVLRILSHEFPYQYDADLVKQAIEDVQNEQGFMFTEEQLQAIYSCIEHNVFVISGKAGSGKTSVIKGIMRVLTSINKMNDALVEVGACALSGKASQRIYEATGFRAMTMHRLLGYNPTMGWEKNRENPLFQDIIFIDEFSMVNTDLAHRLFSAIKNGAKLIIAGDVGQLEPIGVGNVLVDLIESKVVPVVELTKVHRQAQKSGILSSANKVREGKSFITTPEVKKQIIGDLKDLYYYPYLNGDKVERQVLEIAKKYKGDIMEFQILVPMRNRGKLATKNLNQKLQVIFNADPEYVQDSKKVVKGTQTFLEGDKVIINGNNYEKNVFNGTIGTIAYIDSKGQHGEIVIDFETVGNVSFTKEEMNQIDLGYAITIHKYQGSQVEYAVLALDNSSYIMLNRQLVYTGMTRASKYLFLVTEKKALEKAIKTDNSKKRNTFLKKMLRSAVADEEQRSKSQIK